MCSLFCPAEKVVVYSSPFYIDDFIQNQFEKDKEIELYFHSTNDNFTSEINSTYSHEKKLTLKVISNSKPIKVKFKEENSSTNQIELKPSFQVDLPNLNPFKSINRISKDYIYDDPKPTPVPISVGLVQMTITGNVDCEPSNFNANNLNNLGCSTTDLNSESAYQCGYRCWTSSADYEYTFTGVKFELFGTNDPLHGKFNIIIDNRQTIEINEYSNSRQTYSLLYSSDELPYDIHHIKIQNKGETYELYKLTYLPSLTAIRVNSTSLTKEGDWTSETDGIGGVRQYSDSSSTSASITIRCSKIWLYGSTMYWGGKMNVDYNGNRETISLRSDNRQDQVLILETSYFPFDEYNIQLSRNEYGTLTIFCLYYIDEPPPPSQTPKPTPGPTPVPISVGLVQMTITGNVDCEPSNFNANNLNNLGCSTTDLNSESAYQCGYRCWTSSADYEYTFIGVKFELFGTNDPLHGKFNIIIDDWKIVEINEYSNSRQMYSLLYSSDELPYGEHHVKIKNKGYTYELYKLTYLPSLTAVRVNSTSLTKEGNWTSETDGIGGVRQYSDSSPTSASITIRCSKIWLYGSTMYWGGKMNVDYNGNRETISLRSDDRQDQVLILETSYFPFDEYNIQLSRNEYGTLTIFCLYYIDEPPPQTPFPSLTPEPTPTPTPVPISVGLTQMTITGGFNCEPSYFNADNLNNLGCSTIDLDSESAYQCGYRCWTSSADYEYTFIGVKFELFGTRDPQHGKFNIIIDDWKTVEINENSRARKMYSLLYSSDDLPYGEHHIKIQNKGETYELYKLTYFPSYPVARINSTSFTKEGNWASQTDGIGGLRDYVIYGSGSAKIDLRCTKVWIYGSKTPWSVDMTIDFAGTKTTIDLNNVPRRDGVLLYESPDVILDDYTLTISSTAGTITLYCIYYTDSTPLQSPSPKPTFTPSKSPEPSMTPEPTPEDSPYITPIPISVGLTEMELQGHIYCNVANFNKDNIQNLGCNINDLDIEAAYKCGYKCWSYGDANLSYTFKGVKFAIYGTFDPFHQTFDLRIDNKPPIIINEYNESRQEYTLIYLSDDLDYTDHTVRIIGRDEIYEIYKIVYWPKMKSVRVNSTQLIKTPGWTAESDGIGGVREYTNSQGNSAAITIFCNRFWVYSSTCSTHETMILTFGGQIHTIDLHSDQRVDGAIVFDSNEMPQDKYTLIFTSAGVSMIYCIYYENDPPPATQTPYPSRTYFPEASDTYIDRIFVNFIMTDQIEVVDSSPIDRISGCQFIEIIENIDFLIRLEKEIPFYDNIFDYKSSQSIVQAPLYSMYNGKLTVKNCTFNNSRCRKKEGNVLSCHPDYSIDVSFQSCTFFNCGISPNEAIINISNKDSTIKLSDCNFSFKNGTAASSVFYFLGLNAEIEACNFDRCGTIYFNCQYSNGTFSFINNTATNLCQQFLNVSDMSSITEISGNVFKNVLIKKQSFIYIVHHDDEIDLKNNTFENITSKDSLVCGGGISMIILNSEFLLTQFIFDHCYFIDNVNNRTSDSKFSFGGAFHFGYSAFTSNSSVQFVNCEFRGNDCTDGKGGALVINIYDDIILSDCIFERNKAKEEGGAIYIIGRINQQNGPEIVDQLKNSLLVKNCQFIENQGSEGSAIYLLEDGIEFDTFEVNSCTFIDNGCFDNQSFCIHCSSLNKAKFINSSVSFTQTYDNRCRPLLFIYNESVELIESNFVNCYTINESALQLIANQDDSLSTVSNCTIINCVSSMYSFTIINGKIFVSNSSFTFSENEISSCSGLEINSPVHCEIYNCEFHNNNNKVLNGGSLYIHTKNGKRLDKLKIDGLLFNNCIGSSFRTISIIHDQLTEEQTILNNLQIHNISTGGSIYGIHVNNDVLFDHFVFQDNQFSNELGGGYGSYLIPPNHITFTDCLWKNNYCSDNGGAFGGVLYNIETLLELKSLSFINCKFTTNSALGNGGALYINMASDSSPIKIEGCLFEVNRASGDCGAIFIETKNIVVIESCSFVNNSAFKSLSVNSPTDTLYIHGNGYVLLNNTNFSKGTYPNEQSNYQFSHINSYINEAIDFNITISYCMFSIINPSMNQLFAREVDNSGFFYIIYSTFTHFFTQNQNQNAFLLLESEIEQEKDDYKQMNNFLASQQDYNHLFTDLNAPVYIVQCCFDNDEYIIKTATSRSIKDDIKLTTKNNSLSAECIYPKIIDEMIIEIENFKYSNGPIVSINPDKRNKSNKTRNIIIGTVVGAVCLIVIVVCSVLIPYLKKKKKKEEEIPEKINIKSIEFDSEQEIEMTQETNDVINFKYSTYSFSSSHLVSQEISTIHGGRKIHSPTSTSNSSDFEEAKWDNSYV